MIVSIDKNQWLFKWMSDCWRKDIHRYMHQRLPQYRLNNEDFNRNFLADFLATKGYTAKVTDNDILLSISEEEFVFLKLKYA